jgi:hypothetical protein
VAINTPKVLLDVLSSELSVLEGKFLGAWLPANPAHAPNEYEYDVKAYCVLAHAAFEEFVEDLSLLAIGAAKDAWFTRRFSFATICLLSAYGFSVDIVADDDASQERVLDQIREGLLASAGDHSTALSKNHGFSMRYLRGMLTPVGIDIPDTLKAVESLRTLSKARGSFAHGKSRMALYGDWKQADRPMSPEQAQLAVRDCFELCEELGRRFENNGARNRRVIRAKARTRKATQLTQPHRLTTRASAARKLE